MQKRLGNETGSSPGGPFTLDQAAAGGIGFALHDDVERVSTAIRGHHLTRVYAVPYEWNAASFRVLEKAGSVCEGRMRRSAIKDGRVIDQLLYADAGG